MKKLILDKVFQVEMEISGLVEESTIVLLRDIFESKFV